MCKKKEVTPPQTTKTKMMMKPTTAKGCRRRIRRTQTNNNKSLIKTISLLFIIGGTASLIAVLQYNPTAKTQLITKLSKIELKHTISNISSALQDIPKKRRLGGSGSGGIIKLTESSKLFDFDEEMDKSENAFLSVSLPEDVEKNKNPLERVLEGIEDLFNGLEDMFNNSKNNLRNKHRNMKASAVGGGGDAAEVGGETQRNWIPSIITNFYSPIAGPLIAFIGIIFAIASFASRLIVSSPTSNSHRQVDENEAEIIQFYEKQMECGTLIQGGGMPLFSQDVKLPSHPLIRQGSGCNSGSFDMNTTATLRRSVSEPEKTYRGSQGDLYYSRVLETLHLDDEEEVEGVDPSPAVEIEPEVDQQVVQEDTEDDLQDCQITLLENISSLTEDDWIVEPDERVERDESDEVDSPFEVSPCSPQPQEAVVDDEDTCFESAVSQIIPEQDGHQEESQSCPSSPESTSSTISSLTVEDYDIETGSFNIPPVPSMLTSPLALEHEATTPQRSNLSQNRKLSKRVSFSPDIKIREIPRRRCQVCELSSEMYLYIMLFTVAIVIAVFSFMPPPHPKLSPVSCGEMFLRAEKMLSSQWDVEL